MTYQRNQDAGTAFPSNPRTGDQFYRTDENKFYVYDSGWQEVAGGGAETGTSFPVSPADGDLFYHELDAVMYMYSGTAAAWIDISSAGAFPTAVALQNETIDGGVSTGDPVYYDGVSWKKAANGTDRPTAVASAVSDEVVLSGLVTSLTGLTAGADYYLATGGGLTTDSGQTGIFIGVAKAATELQVDIDTASGGVTGSGVANQVALWNGTSDLDGNAGFTYDGSTLLATVASSTLTLYDVSTNAVMDLRGSATNSSAELILGDSVTWNNIKWTNSDLLEVGSSSPLSVANTVDTALTATSAEGSLQILGGVYITKNLNAQGNVGVTGTLQFYTGGAATGAFVSDILDEDDMVSDSATALATQQSIKAYVDAQTSAASVILTSQTIDGGVSIGDPVRYVGPSGWFQATKTTVRPTGVYVGSNTVVLSGEATGLSGLTAGSDYFLAAAGGLTTNSSETGIFIGTALSTTSLNVDIDDGYEELDDDNIPSPTVVEVFHPDKDGFQAFSFTRGSTATYIGADGLIKTAAVDEPRKEFDPITRRENGWLIEEGRTNICLQSEDFSTTWSTLAASVTTNATTAPDGNTTADKIVEDGTTNIHRVGQGGMTITNAANDRFAVSVFAKLADAGRPILRIETGGTSLPADASYFNVSTGTVGTKGVNHENSYMEPLPDGWYRCVVIVDPIGAASDGNIFFYGAPSETNSWAGDGTSGMYMWGADVESCSSTREASSYIPTTTAAVTRSADLPSAHRDVAGFNPNEGTFYIEGRIKHNNVTGASNRTTCSLAASGDTGNTYWLLYWESNDRIINITRRATVQTVGLSGTGPVLASDDKFATALSYDLNAGGTDNHRISTDGYTAGLASVANPSGPVLTGSEYIWLGVLSGITEWLNGYITKFLYFPSNMSAAQVQRATQTRNG